MATQIFVAIFTLKIFEQLGKNMNPFWRTDLSDGWLTSKVAAPSEIHWVRGRCCGFRCFWIWNEYEFRSMADIIYILWHYNHIRLLRYIWNSSENSLRQCKSCYRFGITWYLNENRCRFEKNFIPHGRSYNFSWPYTKPWSIAWRDVRCNSAVIIEGSIVLTHWFSLIRPYQTLIF